MSLIFLGFFKFNLGSRPLASSSQSWENARSHTLLGKHTWIQSIFSLKMYLEEKLNNNKQEIFEKEPGAFSSRYQNIY